MNNVRRSSLRDAADYVMRAKRIVDDAMSQEEFSLENLPEGIADGERGEKMERTIELLEGASDDLESAVERIRDAIK